MKVCAMQQTAVSLLIRIYVWLLGCYPADFRAEFGNEMTAVFTLKMEAAATQGLLKFVTVWARENTGVVAAVGRQWLYVLRTRPRLAATAGGGTALMATATLARRPLFYLAGALAALLGLFLLLFLVYWLYLSYSFSRYANPPRVQEVALADVTGNGYLDAYLAIAPNGEPYNHPDILLFNEGEGLFRDSGQKIENMLFTTSVKLGDVNGNGRTDLVMGWHYGVKLVLNYDQGFFDRGSYSAGGFIQHTSRVVALADLNNDGTLDIFGAGACCSSHVWLNNGDGTFAPNRRFITQVGSNAVALADLNGNGALDAFLANGSTVKADGNYRRDAPNTVWLNDGQGNFSDSGQLLGASESTAVALGDVTGNGFPDAVVGNRGPDEIWLNDGQGNFRDSGRRLGSGLTRAVFLADLDGDGAPDLVVADETGAQVWLNDGMGQFSQGQQISYGRDEAITLGDVTGNGMVDIFVAGVASYRVWRGQRDGRFIAGPRTDFR
jgi:hypothetical protein